MNRLVSRAVLEDSGALKEGISQPISPIIDYSISIYLQSPREATTVWGCSATRGLHGPSRHQNGGDRCVWLGFVSTSVCEEVTLEMY